jgi:pimeloyl-ACP methyl ester carboxylesterase
VTSTRSSVDDLVHRLSAFSRAPIGRHEEEMAFVERDGRRYFSVAYRPAPDAPRSSLGAALIHSFGFEQLTLHPLEVLAARALAERGIPAVYLQAQGYGDSGGDFARVSLATHVRDALVAADRLRELFAVDRVALAGPRFGAAAALLSAQERPGSVHAMAAWHPLVRGKSYFDSMLRSAAAGRLADGSSAGPGAVRRQLEETGRLDLHGYPVHRTQFEEGVELDLCGRLERAPGHVLLVEMARGGTADPDHRALRSRLKALGARVEDRTVALQGRHDIALPVPHAVTPAALRPAFERVVDVTVAWIAGLQ